MFLTANCLKEVSIYLISKDTMNIEQTIRIGKSHLNGAHVMDIDISAVNKRMLFALNNGTVRAVSYKEETYSQIIYTIKISESPLISIYLQSL
jgi:hypothetical protein